MVLSFSFLGKNGRWTEVLDQVDVMDDLLPNSMGK